MCGIAGFQGKFDAELLRKMADAISHRGPDDSGEWYSPEVEVGLTFRRLAIIDLSSLGHQPMSDVSNNAVIVFNGEIYNFKELRLELKAEGYSFRGRSDTEVLLTLFLRDGLNLLQKLNGIFAFAIWDKRREELFLARDALGVKPLYYGQSKQGFAFASEVKALLPLPEIASELDTISLTRYLSFLWCPGETTLFKGVRKLGPGEAMLVRNSRIKQQWKWYQLPTFRVQSSPMSEAAATQETLKTLRNAVRRQLVADVPVGAFLSGGLDSSAIVAMAREKVPNIHCFTIESQGGTDEGMVDDLPYAKQVAKHLGVPLEMVSINSSRMASDLERMIYQLDEPLADPAPLNVLYVSHLAREHGIKVLLSGTGGDDLLSGYRRHVACYYEPLWSWLPNAVRNKLNRMILGRDQRNPLVRRLTKLFSSAVLEGDARYANYFLWAQESRLKTLYTQEFHETVKCGDATQPMLDFLASMPKSTHRLERLLALEQRFFLADHNLIYTDKMSMAVGVEVRVPFLDLELVEFAARIPPKLKQRRWTGKWVLKKAMESYLPRDVIYRPKSSFGAPLRRWMHHELRELLGDLLSTKSLKKRGIFDATATQQLIKQNDRGEVDASYTLFSLLCIEIWCRQFLDRSHNQCVGVS